MKYFIVGPALAHAATPPAKHGWANGHYYRGYEDDSEERNAWILLNNGEGTQGWTGNKAGSQVNVEKGLALAVWHMGLDETVQIDETPVIPKAAAVAGAPPVHTGSYKYDVRGADGHYKDGWKTQPAQGVRASLQAVITTLATVRNGGNHNNVNWNRKGSAENTNGEGSNRRYNAWVNAGWHDHDEGQHSMNSWSAGNRWGDYSDCSVVGVFRSDPTNTHAAKQRYHTGDAFGIVLHTRQSLNWDNDARSLCEASQAANKYLSENSQKYWESRGYKNGKWARHDDGLSTGAIAAIVIGSVAFVVLVVVLVYCFCCSGESGNSSI